MRKNSITRAAEGGDELRKPERAEPASAPRPWPRSLRYSLMGVAIGLGSPIGMLLIRFYTAHHGTFLSWGLFELLGLKWLYLYTGIGSMMAFALFGYVLGRMNDSLQRQAESLRKTARTLRRLCIRDGLTGLYTHTYVVKRLEEEFERARRYGYPLSCLFIDVDDFKDCNDLYGHVFGDRALIEISRALSQEIRDTDILGRYGGDEFLAILPEAGAVNAFRVAERIRKAVGFLRLEMDDKQVPVTVSVGVYSPAEAPAASEEILEKADLALRRAKEEGKNRTVELPERALPAAANG